MIGGVVVTARRGTIPSGLASDDPRMTPSSHLTSKQASLFTLFLLLLVVLGLQVFGAAKQFLGSYLNCTAIASCLASDEIWIMDNKMEHSDIGHQEAMRDHDVLGHGNATREDAMHWGELTEEEKVHEKKLKRKIDFMIMPLVMLVRLWNTNVLGELPC